MITHDFVQGSEAWHAHRATHFNASDAPAMLGCSPYETRTQLLHRLHTGIAPEPSWSQQMLYDEGHEFEALARPLAEEIIGETLYPVVGSPDETVPGLSRPLSSSFDGITVLDDPPFEHKRLNKELRAVMVEGCTGADLPKRFRVQMEQQLLTCGGTRVLFMASEWTDDGLLIDERHCWYYPDPVLRAEIIGGWKQFDADLAAYTPVEVLDRPAPVGHSPDQLPALRTSVKGDLVLESNIKEWETAALAYIKQVRDHELKTDQDFEDADKAAKWCDGSKTTLLGVRAQLMSATGDVNTVVGTLDRIMGELDETRIAFEKKIKARKEARKGEIVAGAIATKRDRTAALNLRLGKPYLPDIPADFAGVIKGKSSLSKMQDAVDTELARWTITAHAEADKIDLNLRWLRENAKDFTALFPDTGIIVLKAHDDLVALAQNRITAHKQAEAARLEAEREKIRQEEADKEAEKNRMRLSEISGIQQQVIIASLGRAGVRKGGTIECIRDTLAETERWVIEESNFGPLTATAQAAKDQAIAEIRVLLSDAEASAASAAALTEAAAAVKPVAPAPAAGYLPLATAQAAASANVVPLGTRRPAAAPATAPTLKLGQIAERLGFALHADFLKQLGFEPAAKEKGAVLFHEHQYPLICEALVAHVRTAQAKFAEAA